MFTPFAALFRRFRSATSGSLVVEAVLIVPIMFLGMTGFVAFWDVYRSQNTVQKASYAVADMLSREMVPATPAFLDGLEQTLEYLIRADARIRVTSIRRMTNGPNGVTGLQVLWSYSPRNAITPLTTATLSTVERHIPMMGIGSNMMLFEVNVPYVPITDILPVSELDEVVAMRPRFLPTLCMINVTC